SGYGDFRLGQHVRVKVAAADVDARQINFSFMGRLDEEGDFKARTDSRTEMAPLTLGNFREPTKREKTTGKPGRRDKKGSSTGVFSAIGNKAKSFGKKKGKGQGKSKNKSRNKY
ncbi:MAG: hypothetical protein QMB63_01410, partial [Clostridiaceae bacterium]